MELNLKRSEMVNIIRRELDAQIGDSVSDSFDLDQLLSVMEAKGMLPPQYSKELSCDEREEFDSNSIEWYTYVEKLNEWEPEDD